MAFENFPQNDQPETVNNVVVKKDNTKTILFAVVAALALGMIGTWAYILIDKNKNEDTLIEKENTIATTSSQRDQLQQDLEEAALRYDLLKSDNTSKDSSINSKDAEIKMKQDEIRKILSNKNATDAELSNARNMIASLNGDINVYKERIVLLEGQKQQLIGEKAAVTQQRNSALKNYDSARVLIKQKESKLELGSTLVATNFNILGIDNKKSGKEKVTSTAKRVDRLRVSFDLAENMIAESGEKEIYVCITGPDGSPIAVPGMGSGTFTTRNGDSKTFTKKLNVEYTQAKKRTVSFDWEQNSDFKNGEYKIEVYNNGFKVGDAYKPLKKAGLFG